MSDEQADTDDFGSYVASVMERDIDLLLMEEFHVSPDFVDWFCSQLGLIDVEFAGAWLSVSAGNGETDLLLRVRAGGNRVGVLIENKVGAAEQDRQDERYHLRGVASLAAGKLDSFVTCMCAPQIYLDRLSSASLYEYRIAYESISEWFSRFTTPREIWRRRIMQEAIEHGRRGYRMVVNATTSKFHLDFWEALQAYPQIHMRNPGPKGSSSTWFVMRGHDFPKDVQLDFKAGKRVVELGFFRRRVADLHALERDWGEGVLVVQNGETASLQIRVPAVGVALAFESQRPAIDEVFQALLKLVGHGRAFETE